MRVTMIAMTSADGRLTKGDDTNIQGWRSSEEAATFTDILGQHEVVIVGRKGYEAAGCPKPREGRLYAVMTRNPKQFEPQTVPNQLEFINYEPAELIRHLEKRGYDSVAVTTGGQLNGMFLAADLIDEIYLTIEPWLFGDGLELAGNQELNIALRLDTVKQLNKRGTLLAHYYVQR